MTLNKSTYNVQNQNEKTVQRSQVKVKQNYVHTYTNEKPKYENIYSGSIKGIVKVIKYERSKKSWLYEISGVDTSNFKLPFAKFYYKKKLANHGDLVYVILKNSKLKNLFFINKTNQARYYERKNNTADIVHKRNKSRIVHWISVPKVERVNF
ncbi:MAG: hypothetical protein R3331_08445 [Sulfurospirillaceae bacterium]|nr:hypothetical protein [Sulfurospirillaceae bacterium]